MIADQPERHDIKLLVSLRSRHHFEYVVLDKTTEFLLDCPFEPRIELAVLDLISTQLFRLYLFNAL